MYHLPMKLTEWTQTEYLINKNRLKEAGTQVFLIDTILNAIEGVETNIYNPHEINKLPKGSYLVFYCDSGKATKNRLKEYANKFPDFTCISLKGGRGYWRPYLRSETLT